MSRTERNTEHAAAEMTQEELRERADPAEYNRQVGMTTKDDYLPGSVVSEAFGVPQGPYDIKGQLYETTAHSGVDLCYPEGAVRYGLMTPYYTSVLEVRTSLEGLNFLTLEVLGSERSEHIVVRHADAGALASLSRGMRFFPGQIIIPYPTRVNGTGTGIHFHIERTIEIGGERLFADPFTGEIASPNMVFLHRYDGGVWLPTAAR